MPDARSTGPDQPPEPPGAEGGAAASTASGPGRALVAVYGIFALAATARAGFQIATRLSDAPVAYLLSGLSAVVYVVATLALARSGRRARQVAWCAVVIELVGVLTVGVASLVDPAAFPDETVWSAFGQGYGYVPLVLPMLGIAWLWFTRPGSARSNAASPDGEHP